MRNALTHLRCLYKNAYPAVLLAVYNICDALYSLYSSVLKNQFGMYEPVSFCEPVGHAFSHFEHGCCIDKVQFV